MSRKKIDRRISFLIRKTVAYRERCMFFVLGEKLRDQVVYLYHLLNKYRKDQEMKTPTPLWCFKKELGFNLFHNKKLKKMRKNYASNYELSQEDVFQHFLLTSNIQVCHYSETDKILGQTFGMLVIQDFNALTPNILARIIETVEGGGMIVFLLTNINSLEEVFSMNMDAHSKYITEAYKQVNSLFNKRLVLSLYSCINCLVLDENLKVRMVPEKFEVSDINEEKIISNVKETAKVSNNSFEKLLTICCTSDQTSALIRLSETLNCHNNLFVTALTSGRGRGKSAVLGLAIASAIKGHLSNIYVTSPHLENVMTLFAFIIKGLIAMEFKENEDFKVIYSDASPVNFITGVQIFKKHKQTVSYLSPLDHSKLGNADLVVIDEAAAIPLSNVKKWLGSYNVWMASTINGYEGTGRSLSLKLINQLRNQSVSETKQRQDITSKKIVHTLQEISLTEAIRYSNNDNVETWLNNVLCLDATADSLIGLELPPAENCQLFCINREALFSYNQLAEKFLQQVVSLFVTSHYKNTPNDLMMMADAPAHQLFCLTTPVQNHSSSLPTVLCVVQIALEGKISIKNYNYEQSHGRRASGDLIPWIISQQFQSEHFISLSGARVVRIATNPDCQGMGYGKRTLQLLCQFYDGSLKNSEVANDIKNSYMLESSQKPSTLPLLFKLEEIQQESLDYIGVSYGLTSELLKFWKTSGFVPLYLRQTTNDVTGEHSCVMLKKLKPGVNDNWLQDFYSDFTSRFVSLLPSAFSSFSGSLALSILHCKNLRQVKNLSASELHWFMSFDNIKRLDAYCNNLVDHHLILDLLPGVSKLYFSGCLNGYFLSSVQEVILLSVGLQHKTVEIIANELGMEVQQVMGCFKKTLKKIVNCINSIYQSAQTSV